MTRTLRGAPVLDFPGMPGGTANTGLGRLAIAAQIIGTESLSPANQQQARAIL